MAQTTDMKTSSTAELTAAELGELMQSVMETAERLQSTHDALQDQVKRLERELAEANAQLHRSRELASLGEMAAGIAHEIRNPLASIQLYTEVLAEELRGQSEQGDICRKIDISIRRLDVIVRDVLQFARETTVRFVFMPASELLTGVVECCSDLDTNVQVDVGDDPQVRVDPSLMIQAMGNIVRNGIESMESIDDKTKCLELCIDETRLRCPDGVVRSCTVLRVEDRGCGIPGEIQERLFNPFFTTRAGGTGLGLAIAHRVVDAHGGYINVTNREGGGTRFEVCLPAPNEHDDIARAMQE